MIINIGDNELRSLVCLSWIHTLRPFAEFSWKADILFCIVFWNFLFVCICSKELMYQQVLRRFAHFNAIQLSESAPLQELLMLALKEEELDLECNENDDLKMKIAEVTSFLLSWLIEILSEFSSMIETDRNNCCLDWTDLNIASNIFIHSRLYYMLFINVNSITCLVV